LNATWSSETAFLHSGGDNQHTCKVSICPMGGANAVSDSELNHQPANTDDDPCTEKASPVPLLSLFTGADAWDCLAIAFGIAGALVNGATYPMFAFAFGEVPSNPRLALLKPVPSLP